MTITADPKANGGSGYSVIGTRPIRHDGLEKVTGQARYGEDVNLPGMLFGKVLRSPHAHARIKKIDASRALALTGVEAVVTSAELVQASGKAIDLGEGAMTNPKFLSNNILAADKALYKGHAIAGVAATSPHIAEEALRLIDVEYEVLPAVLDAKEAMKPGAPILHERLANFDYIFARPGGLKDDDDQSKSSNVSLHFVFETGDIQKGFKEADVIVEREYHTKAVHQGYIEPHAATAMWNRDGKVTLWSSSQGHFTMREQTALVLGLPVSQVKAIQMEIGGGFGGKTLTYLEPVAALLSQKTGKPVKVSMSRVEVFEGTGPTSGGYINVKIGATKDGKITAAEAVLMYEAGAFPGSPVIPGSQCMFGPYNLENARVEGYDIVINTPKVAAYRAPGAPAAAFAAETAIDELAEKLGMDSLELRILNGAKEGTRRLAGPVFPRIGFLETVQAAKDHPHYNAPLEGPNRGRGVAGGFWFNAAGPAAVTASVHADGTISLVEGSPDIGGHRVAVAMHVAEVLGIPAEDVHPSIGDTDSIAFTSMTGGSGALMKTGIAAYEAAQDIKSQLIRRAGNIWDVSVDDIDMVSGVIQHKSDPELRFTFKELASMLNATGGPIVGSAGVDPKGVGVAFGVHIADVEVDPETGKTQVLRYTAVQDVGTAIHPSYVEGQIQGGAVQGIGWALNEEYVFNKEGVMANPTFLDYRMPISLDLPMIDAVLVEVPNPGHPYGLRGVGETPIVPPMAAIANAIHNAIGVRMTELPMSPGVVLEALWNKDNSH